MSTFIERMKGKVNDALPFLVIGGLGATHIAAQMAQIYERETRAGNEAVPLRQTLSDAELAAFKPRAEQIMQFQQSGEPKADGAVGQQARLQK